MGPGCKYYVPREKITPHEVTALLREFDGIPILAHPMQYQFSDEQLRILLRELASCGLIGIEVYYSTHTEEETAYLANLAREFGLLPSGGSDFHGANKPSIVDQRRKRHKLCQYFQKASRFGQKTFRNRGSRNL